jgi:hypothetical protein
MDYSVVELRPYFLNVQEGKLDDFKAIWNAREADVREETGSLFYGFTFNGSTACCREVFLMYPVIEQV